MDWAGVIAHNSAALKANVDTLFAMLGLAGGLSVTQISRAVHRLVLRSLRPTESAVAGHGQFELRRQSPDRLVLNRVVTNTAYASDASNAANDNHKLESPSLHHSLHRHHLQYRAPPFRTRLPSTP
jgi:hypothetical protein